jgi:RNA polymerase sigma factor (sigma-70 family)
LFVPVWKYSTTLSQNTTNLQLFIAHRRVLENYANSIIGSRAQAEDVVQEAWLRFDVATREPLLEDATGYIYRIARNLALDGRRRMKRENLYVTDDNFDTAAGCSDSPPTPEPVALYKDKYEEVMKAPAELPERTPITFERHHFSDAKLRQIVEKLNASQVSGLAIDLAT